MALRSDWSERPCTIARALDSLGDPWVMLILRELAYGVHRFEDIRANIECNDKTLAGRLEFMIETGLIERRQYSGTVRPRFEYFATSAGEEALPILHSLALWGQRNTQAPPLERPFTILCRACGAVATQAETCSTCGSELSPGNTEWLRPITATH